MVRRGDQEGAGFLSNSVRGGNNSIRAPTQRAAADVRTGKVYAGVLVIFLILFGLGISPLPGSSQGNRISNLSEDFGEECVLPSGPLDLDAQGAL